MNQNLFYSNTVAVESVNEHPSFRKNVNWNAYSSFDIFDVQSHVKSVKAQGININTVFIQTHGLSGQVKLDMGMAEPQFIGSPLIITADDVTSFMAYSSMDATGQEQFMNSTGDREAIIGEKFQLIGALQEIMGAIEDGGDLILGGCFSGNTKEGSGNLNSALRSLSSNRINITLNQDGTRVQKAGEQVLDTPLTRRSNFGKGWKRNGESTGLDLQLNSNTPQPTEDVNPR